MIEAGDKPQTNPSKKKVSFMGYGEIHDAQPPTSYWETLANLFKGNVGTGCFAMADAIKNAGIILGPILLTIIAIICIQCFKMLINGAEYIMKVNELSLRPEFAEVVELSFLVNKSENDKWKKCAVIAKTICNIAICVTQLGFCCVYLIFVSSSIKLILEHYGINMKLAIIMTIVLVPVWFSILERKLKNIAIFSGLANICMILGVIFTVGYSLIDLPSFSERKYVNFESLPLFFGTAIFAFEGIALILPLQNAMKEPKKFVGLLGVMNVGMVLVSVIYVTIGFFGYWKFGEATAGSLTLNLPVDQILAQVIIIMVAIGVLFGYPIQFFVAIQILFPPIVEKIEFARKSPVTAELIFRSTMCVVTFAVAQLIPNLSILLSLIGAVFCSVLVFIFPAIIELTTRKAQYNRIGLGYWIKNLIIILMSIIGMILGGGQAFYEIYLGFFKDSN
ncbi:hypothetical protein ACKWTF_005669 [Chironomus riparius]